jgi:sterol desaturase/sphingolipid hydroxylase (fatty acid hydroxylase superfamily)
MPFGTMNSVTVRRETPLNLGFTLLYLATCCFMLRSGAAAAVWFGLVSRLSLVGAYVGFGFALYMSVVWLAALFYYALDFTSWPGVSYFRRFKIQTPLEGASPRARGRVAWRKAVRLVLVNQFAGTLPALSFSYFAFRARGLDEHSTPPGPGLFLLQLLGMLLVEEVLFFAAHYAMHDKRLFAKVHRTHHEFKEPYSIASHYVHPIEHWLGNLFPIFAGPLLLGVHPVCFLMWVVLAVINALHTHSGYDFPWMANAAHHDFHHFHVHCNYGAVGWMDRLLKTDRPFRERLARVQRP